MKMARVILFTGQMDEMSKFYGEVLGLKQVNDEKGWREFGAGSADRAALRPVIARPQGSEDRISRQGRCRSARKTGGARCTIR
jgi:catechol-2,3-dioxygenase